MPIALPPESALPLGPRRDLVLALHELYRSAGKPGTRQISIGVRKHREFPDTVSHEAVGAMLRGSAVVRWSKVESVVRLLATWRVTGAPDDDEVVRRFHALWLRASDQAGPRGAPVVAPALLAPAPAPERNGARAPGERPVGGRHVAGGEHAALAVRDRLRVSLPARSTAFRGRVDLLRALHGALAAARGDPVVLIGPGGLGKSQLALEHAHRAADVYDLVWWLPAEQPAHLRAAFRALAGALAMPIERDADRTVAAVLDRLESRRERWLLVFDNVGDREAVRSALPSGGGDILVTTRDPAVGDLGHPLTVEVFSRAESIDLLQAYDPPSTAEDADRVAARLGDFPLALAQVAALHAATGMSLARYLDVFEGHLQELLAQGRPAGYGTTLSALVDLAVQRVEGEAAAAALLLEVLAHLAPEPVPLGLLRAGRWGRLTPALARCLAAPERTAAATSALARAGLVTFAADTERLTLHRVVRECVHRSLTRAALARGRDNAHATLTSADPGNPDDARSWESYGLLLPHLLPSGLLDAASDEARRLVVHEVRYLHQVGDFEGSRQLAQAALTAWDATSDGEAGSRAFEVSQLLANALRSRAEYTAARALSASTLERLRTSPQYGPDHPLTLQTAFGAGYDLRLAGEYALALALDEEVFARCLRVYGRGHRGALTAENNLAVSLRLLGEDAAAHRHDLDVRAGWRTLLGVHDLLVHRSGVNLAWDLHGMGRYKEMVEQVEEVSKAVGERIGSGRATLLIRRTLAVALRATGRWDDAAAVADEAHADSIQALGQDHEQTLVTGVSRVNSLRSVGRLAAARDLAIEVQDGYRRQFGWRHPVSLAAAVALAAVLRASGRLDEARRIDEQAHRELAVRLGPAHPLAVCAANGLAADLALGGAPGAAATLLEPLAAAGDDAGDDVRDGEPDHPVVLAVRANLAAVRRARGQDGDPAARGALAAVLGADHPQVVGSERGEWLELDVEPPPL